MEFSKVQGKNNRHKVQLYALSTCVWCKMTKQFFAEKDIEYEFVDVDLLGEEDKTRAHTTIISKGGVLSYPTTIVDDKLVITGFQKGKLQEALGV